MKLSIITINYNNVAGLAKTIQSVVEQTWVDFEYIIIDGGSSDGSKELIQQHKNRLSYWVSEPDEGIFHAMNKGIGVAAGEYLLMLNSGDALCNSQVLNEVFSLDSYSEDIIAGDVYRVVEGEIIDKSIFPNVLTFGFLRNGAISHQAAFIKKTVHELVGLYDEGLKYVSDWKFFLLAICKHNISYRHLPFFVSSCDASGLTCIPANFSAMEKEMENVLQQYFSAFLQDYAKFDAIYKKGLRHQTLRLWYNTKQHIKRIVIR